MGTQPHTSGPWTLSADDPCRINGHRQGQKYSLVIAETCGYEGEREANARLIAAAPELVEALEAMCSMMQLAIDQWENDSADLLSHWEVVAITDNMQSHKEKAQLVIAKAIEREIP